MRTVYRLIVSLLLFMQIPFFVSAHGGRESVVVVNKEAARPNSVADDLSAVSLPVPLDIAPKQYNIGELVTFSADTTLLPDSSQTKPYVWNFGDGTNARGLQVSHRFEKAGTYFITFDTEPSAGKPMTTLSVSIVPTAVYSLPQAKLFVNGKEISDTLLDYVEVKPGGTVTFDGGKSTGTIATYQWDFGDKTTGEGKSINHTYKRDTFFPVYALLRVTDENGIASDAVVTIDTPLGNPNPLENLINVIREFFTNFFAKKS